MSATTRQATELTVRPATPDDVPAVRDFMLEIFEQDYGYGYQPHWHWDYDDLVGTYVESPRHTLIVALDSQTGEIIGTGGLRSGGPSSPDWLAERYLPPERTAQIVRVFVHAEHRRRGVARLLVEALRRFVSEVGEYDVICLHTETAVDFWQVLGCRVVHDGRTADPPEPSVHFELALIPDQGHAGLDGPYEGRDASRRYSHHDPRSAPERLDETRALMIRVIELDYGYDYRSRWHDDVEDPAGFYLEHPRQTLLVAVDDHTGQILGTAGVRVLRIASPPHPPEILDRYDRVRTAELTRVFVLPEARRRGIGRALVDAARARVAEIGGFDLIQFHSRTAVDFWRSMPTTEVLDNRRPGGDGPEAGQVYFEMTVPDTASSDPLRG